MRVLVFGSGGQLGHCLLPRLEGHDIIAPGSAEVDFAQAGSVSEFIMQANADFVVNLAAYTAVDRAESEQELANRINHLAVREIAETSHQMQLPLLHVSTDFVFSGAQSTPFQPLDPCQPLGTYGQTKYDGEQAIIGTKPNNSVILRTAWVYSEFGSNFLLSMLRLMSERKSLGIVSDQVGTPTSAHSLANTIVEFINRPAQGIYHWTDAGVASWYDFAVAIYEEAFARNLVPADVAILPISSREYPTPAKRPSFSVLDKSKTYSELGVAKVHWRQELRSVLDRIAG